MAAILARHVHRCVMSVVCIFDCRKVQALSPEEQEFLPKVCFTTFMWQLAGCGTAAHDRGPHALMQTLRHVRTIASQLQSQSGPGYIKSRQPSDHPTQPCSTAYQNFIVHLHAFCCVAVHAQLFQSLGEWAAAYEYVGDLTTELEALQDEDERRRARRLSLRRRMAAQRAQQEAATASGAASASETDAQKEGVAGGGMGPQQQQREQQDDGEVRIGQEEEQGGQLSEQAGGEEGGASGSSGASASAGEGQVDLKQVALSAGLSEEMASLVQR